MNTKALKPHERFFKLLENHKSDLWNLLFLSLLAGIISLSLPLGLQAMVNFIVMGRVSASWVILLILIVLGILADGILQINQMRIIENVQQHIFVNSAVDFAFRLPKIDTSKLKEYPLADLSNRFLDTFTVQKSLTKILTGLPMAIFQLFFGVIVLGIYNTSFLIGGVLLIIITYFALRLTFKKALATSINESSYKYKLLYFLQNLAKMDREFKSNPHEEISLKATDSITAKYLLERNKHFFWLIWQYRIFLIFRVLVVLMLLLGGALLLMQEQINLGEFVAAEIIILMMISASEKVILNYESIFDLLTSLDKIGQVMDINTEQETVYKASSILDESKSPIAIHIKSLRLDDNLAIDDIVLESNKRYWFKGLSLNESETLIANLSGIELDEKAEIYLDDTLMTHRNPLYLRKRIKILAEDAKLLERLSIEENIVFGRDLSDEHFKETLEKTSILKYLNQNGLTLADTVKSDCNGELRMLIALCRILITKPEFILITNKALWYLAQYKGLLDSLLANAQGIIYFSNSSEMLEQADVILEKRDQNIHVFTNKNDFLKGGSDNA
jgi:ABC-type bacteriocin/lantibiotic exporter with double-glycine peptidase domain